MKYTEPKIPQIEQYFPTPSMLKYTFLKKFYIKTDKNLVFKTPENNIDLSKGWDKCHTKKIVLLGGSLQRSLPDLWKSLHSAPYSEELYFPWATVIITTMLWMS